MSNDDGMRLQSGDLVQVEPAADAHFGGCVGIVMRRRSTGAEVEFVPPGGMRAETHKFSFDAIERVGRVRWPAQDVDALAASGY